AIVYFLGPVERVHAMVDTREAGTSRYSGSPAMITWKHTQGERYGSWEIVDAPDLLIRTGYYSADEWVEITGTRGILWVTRCSGDLLGEAPIILCRDGEVRRYHDMAVDWGDSFVRGAHEFTRAIQGGYQPDLDAREARHVLAFSLAAMKSGLERCEVSVEP
ncbi:MAG: gfo/Idh/MocA family oxidoreductase, partial [Gemmatimonadetes bacterium]|nr:gfo/Idh/MocA family oxidoreductase [Gemmatimonadota bacterium]